MHFLLEKLHTFESKELRSQLYSNMCKQSLSLRLADPLRFDVEPPIWPVWFLSFLDKLLLCRSPVKTSKRPLRPKCFSVHFHITHSSFPEASDRRAQVISVKFSQLKPHFLWQSYKCFELHFAYILENFVAESVKCVFIFFGFRLCSTASWKNIAFQVWLGSFIHHSNCQ